MQRQGFVAVLIAVVGVSALSITDVQAGDRSGHSYASGHAQDGYRQDSYSGASRHHNDGRHDGYSGATPRNDSWDLTPEQHRALRNFERQKQRDYRRLGQRRFDSDQQRKQAYRELRRQHHDRLSNIVGEERVRHHRHDN